MKTFIFILIIFLLYGLLFLAIDKLEKNERADSELTRKLLHIGSGLIALLFPLLFKSLTGVVYLGIFFIILLLNFKWFGYCTLYSKTKTCFFSKYHSLHFTLLLFICKLLWYYFIFNYWIYFICNIFYS